MPEDPGLPPEFAGIAAVADLALIQPGAVVSRTLLKKPGGSVTVFAFDSGEGLSEHTAPFDALVLNLQGEAEISISGTLHHLAEGGILKLPAGEPHGMKAITPFKMLLIMIKA